MEINLSAKGYGNIGLGGELSSAPDVKQTRPQTTSAKFEVKASQLDALEKSEPLAEVPDAALSRDDELGKLVSTAFNLPPPPMPNFANL